MGDTKTLTIIHAPLAGEYERVHYVGHYLYNPKFEKKLLMRFARKIEDQVYSETGYKAFVRDIRVKHYAPLWTDVDYIIDSPSESPIAGATVIAILKAIGIVIIAIAVLGIVVFLFWTVWTEKYKRYICEQCPDYPSFEGWLVYMGHLKAVHPEKYEGAKEAGAGDWFTKPVIALGALVILLLFLYMLMKRRER